jgi:predicted ester cyclase
MVLGDHRTTINRLFDEVWNGRRLDAIEELYSPDFVADYQPYALRSGWAGVREMVENAWKTMPDYHEEQLSVLLEGDSAAVHLRISGTQHGAWGPVPPTGRRLEYEEILLLRFAPDGRVIHQRGIADTIAGLRQAGVLPAPTSPSSDHPVEVRP